MIVIFEGMDKVGKTTLIKAFGAKEKYKSLCMDRGPGGYFFYDIIFNRLNGQRLKNLIDEVEEINRVKHIVVYLYADPSDIMLRLLENNEKYIYDVKMDTALEMYDRIVKNTYYDDVVLCLNTSKLSIDDCVNEIIKKVNEYESKCYFGPGK